MNKLQSSLIGTTARGYAMERAVETLISIRKFCSVTLNKRTWLSVTYNIVRWYKLLDHLDFIRDAWKASSSGTVVVSAVSYDGRKNAWHFSHWPATRSKTWWCPLWRAADNGRIRDDGGSASAFSLYPSEIRHQSSVNNTFARIAQQLFSDHSHQISRPCGIFAKKTISHLSYTKWEDRPPLYHDLHILILHALYPWTVSFHYSYPDIAAVFTRHMLPS